MRKLLLLLLVISISFTFFTRASAITINESSMQNNTISNLSTDELLDFLNEYNISIPGEAEDYHYWITEIMEIIEMIEDNPNIFFCYNWTDRQNLAEELQCAVLDYYGIAQTQSVSPLSAYQLQDSTVYGQWTDNYLNYNCYNYALGITNSLCNPGYYSGKTYTLSLTVTTSNVEADLKALNKNCIDIRSSLGSVPSGATAICVRIGDDDYHFMKLVNGEWRHKPGRTNILIYNYSNAGYKDWTNEAVLMGVTMEPTTEYTSNIRYIVYRSQCNYDIEFTGEHYHSGKLHHYLFQKTCDNCGELITYTDSLPCSGPPCILPVNVDYEVN